MCRLVMNLRVVSSSCVCLVADLVAVRLGLHTVWLVGELAVWLVCASYGGSVRIVLGRRDHSY